MQPRLHQHTLITVSKKPLFVCAEAQETAHFQCSAVPSVSLLHVPRCQSRASILSASCLETNRGAVRACTHIHTHHRGARAVKNMTPLKMQILTTGGTENPSGICFYCVSISLLVWLWMYTSFYLLWLEAQQCERQAEMRNSVKLPSGLSSGLNSTQQRMPLSTSCAKYERLQARNTWNV